MVGKTLEYVEAMDKMIYSLPHQIQDNKNFTFLLSKEFAQGLYDYVPMWASKKMIAESGDEFVWRGFNCKVA